MKKLSIGQVIYLFFQEEYSLAPVQVSEEVVVRSLSGEKSTYKVVYGSPPKQAELDDLIMKKAIIFETIEAAQTHMVSKARSTIDRIVSQALATARMHFPSHVDRPRPAPPVPVKTLPFDTTEEPVPEEATLLTKTVEREYDVPVVELSDGTLARVKVGP